MQRCRIDYAVLDGRGLGAEGDTEGDQDGFMVPVMANRVGEFCDWLGFVKRGAANEMGCPKCWVVGVRCPLLRAYFPVRVGNGGLTSRACGGFRYSV